MLVHGRAPMTAGYSACVSLYTSLGVSNRPLLAHYEERTAALLFVGATTPSLIWAPAGILAVGSFAIAHSIKNRGCCGTWRQRYGHC